MFYNDIHVDLALQRRHGCSHAENAPMCLYGFCVNCCTKWVWTKTYTDKQANSSMPLKMIVSQGLWKNWGR